MRKTERRQDQFKKDSFCRLTVNAETLAAMLDCGKQTAIRIGTESGARIKIGKRVLYRVSQVEKYLDELAGK